MKSPLKRSSILTITVPLESLGAFLKSKQSEANMSSSLQQSTTDVVTKSASNVKHLTMHSLFSPRGSFLTKVHCLINDTRKHIKENKLPV